MALGALGITVFYGWLLEGRFMGFALPMFLCFLYSKRNPAVRSNIWGLPPGGFPSIYLPYALAAFTVVLQGDPIPQLVGILVGHIYYYIIVVLPETPGPLAELRLYLATPHALCRAFGVPATDRVAPGQRQPNRVPEGPPRFPGHVFGLKIS